MKTLIKTTKTGQKVEIIDGIVCLDDEQVTAKIDPLPKKIYIKIKSQLPDAAYLADNIVLTKSEGEKAQKIIAEYDARKKAKEENERKNLEGNCKKHRMLIAYGSYYINTEIATVFILPEEEQKTYSKSYQGKIVARCIYDKKNIKINRKNSPTANAIMQKNPSGYTYGSVESAMWTISPEEEKKIIAECQAAEEKEKEKKLKKEAELQAIFAKAKSTGQKQKINEWTTEECSEKLSDCSFDIATEWAMPDGTVKTTYTHCF